MTRQPTPQHVKDKLPSLRRWANQERGYWGAPVYLVGSALSGSNPKPRDWDIRIILSDSEFERHFGDPKKWEVEGASGDWTEIRWKWSDNCVKAAKL